MTGDSEGPQGQPPGPNSSHPRQEEMADALGAEAARLAAAFTEWVGERTSTDGNRSAGADDGVDHRSTIPEQPVGRSRPDDPGMQGAAGGRGAGDEPRTAPDSAPSASPVCGCGSQTGIDVVCRMCPICRAAEFLQTVRPEVLQRYADILAMVAGSLQAIAADRPAQRTSADASEPPNATDSSDGTDSREPAGSARGTEAGISIPVHGEEAAGDGADDRED